MRGNRNVGELVLVSINCCYCYLLYVAEAVGAGPRILETIYPIGWREECDGWVGRKLAGTKGPVGVDMGKCKWSEECDFDVVKHAGKEIL